MQECVAYKVASKQFFCFQKNRGLFPSSFHCLISCCDTVEMCFLHTLMKRGTACVTVMYFDRGGFIMLVDFFFKPHSPLSTRGQHLWIIWFKWNQIPVWVFYGGWITKPEGRVPAACRYTSTSTHKTNSNRDSCQEDCLLNVSAGCQCVWSSLHRSTPQLWTCGQWVAYLASSSPRNLSSLENQKLTKLTRFSR